MLLVYDNVPLIKAARLQEARNRESAFKGTLFDICGLKVRQMTVRDFLILDVLHSPLITNQGTPSLSDLAQFLWIISPEIELWNNETGWRFDWLPFVRRICAYRHGRRIRKLNAYDATVAAYRYVSAMFQDAPAGSAQKGESYITFLAGWCDTLRSEYKCTEDEIFAMPLPKLFGYLRAMELRKNPEPRLVNRSAIEIRQQIVRGLNEGRFTIDDVMRDDFKLN